MTLFHVFFAMLIVHILNLKSIGYNSYKPRNNYGNNRDSNGKLMVA